MKAIGLDIGTTTICGVVLDGRTGEVLYSRMLQNSSGEQADGEPFEKMQNPGRIWESICELLDGMQKEHPEVDSIGLTGQMHGILYVNEKGEAVSRLYTWQDESGNERWPGGEAGETYAFHLTKLSDCFMASGFGLTTCFYQSKNHKVPAGAAKLCTIHDYIGMKLTGRRTPLMSPSDAASIGIYDLEKNGFMTEKAERAGIDKSLLPEVQTGAVLLGTASGEYYAGVPVSIGLGDNQASVIGSVKNIYDTVLVNIGTGSQISVGTKEYVNSRAVELRPLTGEDYIFAGSCLCGGRAYAALEQFFRQVCRMAGMDRQEKLYGAMAEAMKQMQDEKLTVDTRFCGTRENPVLRGSISGIDLNNFTPQAMVSGFLYGIAGELYGLYQQILPQLPHKPSFLVGSGNGVRMNPALQGILEEMFGCKLQIPVHTEEAAYGTALFSLVAAGLYPSLEEAQKVIRYIAG